MNVGIKGCFKGLYTFIQPKALKYHTNSALYFQPSSYFSNVKNPEPKRYRDDLTSDSEGEDLFSYSEFSEDEQDNVQVEYISEVDTQKMFEEISSKGDYLTPEDFAKLREKIFIDRVKVIAEGGQGGLGCFSHYRDKKIRTGAPDGGDGGRGGDIVLKAVPFFKDLSHFKRHKFVGNKGGNGRKVKKAGKNGKDLHISVPTGTIVWELKTVQKDIDAETSNIRKRAGMASKYQSIKTKMLADLSYDESTVVVAKGGKGGRGNAAHRQIQEAEQGKLGEETTLLLEMKTIADIGLVGYPNAGKSTTLATFTRGLTKIAPYPFTTLQPAIGKIKFIDEYAMTLADIPGLIEGASENKGLGHEFLRHIERTKVLMFVIDINSEDPIKEYQVLTQELLLYNEKLFKNKPRIIILNKIDLEPNHKFIIDTFQQHVDAPVYGMSAKHSENLSEVIVKLREIVSEVEQKEKEEAEEKAKEQERLWKTNILNFA